MSEPIKKPRQIPESYSPKKPEIVNMVKNVQNTQMQIPPVSSFAGKDGIYKMPQTRFIGVKHNHLPGEDGRKLLTVFINTLFSSEIWDDVVKTLPNIMNDELIDFTCEYEPKTDSFSFIMGVFSPPDTPVAEGLEFHDIMPTLVWISQKDVAGHEGKSEGIPGDYEINYGTPHFPWQAFLRADSYSVNPIKLKTR